MTRYSLLPLLLWLSVPGTVHAQAPEPGLCWAAHPQPRCGAFLVTNAGLYTRLIGSPADEFSPSAVFDGGFMVNVTRRDAVGVSYMGSLETNSIAGPAVRYRRWFKHDASLDLALGVPTSGASGVFGLVKVSPANWIGIALRPKLVRYPYSTQTQFRTTVGLELSGPPGLAMTAVAYVVAVIALLSSGNVD